MTAAETVTTEEAPSITPEDFIFFVKTVYERIQLAFASDELEEAILLAQFAQERLAESDVLLKEGDIEKAELRLQLSLTQQQQAIETAASVIDPATETIAESATDVEAEQTEDAAEEEEAVEPAQADKVKNSLQHNIVALTAALEKVKNPQAQSSLMKNITKSFAHLEKKLAKISAKTEAETTTETATEPEATETAAPTATPAPTPTAEVTQETATSVITEQSDEQKPKKEKEKEKKQQSRAAENQNNKPEKSHGNAGKGEAKGQDHHQSK